jgi:hypothetical protein
MSSSTSCKIKYLVRGVEANRESKENLRNEILDMLPKAEVVTLLPVVEGFSLDIEVSDISPFSESSFESYLSDQILLEAIELKCDPRGQISLELVKSNFF